MANYNVFRSFISKMIQNFKLQKKIKRIIAKKRDIKSQNLYNHGISQKLQELNVTESIYCNLSPQELLPQFVDSKKDIVILQYNINKRDFASHINNITQSLYNHHYRLFDIETNDEIDELNRSHIIRLTYVLEGSHLESELLNSLIPTTTATKHD